MAGLSVLVIFIACAAFIQHRGRARHATLSRKLNDHANFLAPVNCLFYAFSAVRPAPYLAAETFGALKPVQANWQSIRDEALALNDKLLIKASDQLDDIGFNSFFRTGWKRFYLKWYGASLVSARELCPHTVALLDSIPNVKGAMFAMLPPGARLVRHRDPYAGSLRYHLGLQTPNSPDCFISVDGEPYHWRDGEAVVFDETYLHYAENQSDQNRIILFLDIKRPVWFAPVDWLNELLSRVLLSASATRNLPGDRVGALNRAFSHLYQIRRFGKRIKARSVPVYYLLQYLLYAVLLGLVILVINSVANWLAGS